MPKNELPEGTTPQVGTRLPTVEDRILENKVTRVQLDKVIQELRSSPYQSRERSLAITKLQEARHWLGEDLNQAGAPYPYPQGNDPKTTKVDPPTDVAS